MRKEIECEGDKNRGDHSIKRGDRAEMRVKWRQNESRKKHIERRRKTIKEEKCCTNTQKKSEMKRYWQEKFKEMAERNREKNGERINLLPNTNGENSNIKGETERLEGIETETQETATPEIETEAEKKQKVNRNGKIEETDCPKNEEETVGSTRESLRRDFLGEKEATKKLMKTIKTRMRRNEEHILETVIWRENRNEKRKMINLEWKRRLEEAGITVNEMIGEIDRIQRKSKAKEKQENFLIKAKRKEKAKEKQEEFVLGQELRKVEKVERQKEEVYEMIFNIIKKKEEEKEMEKEERRKRFRRIEEKKEKQKALNEKRCKQILEEVIGETVSYREKWDKEREKVFEK